MSEIQEIRGPEGYVIRYKWGEIFQHLNDIMGDIGAIKKEKSGTGISYKFRGIDQVYAALQPLLIKHKVIVLPTKTRDVRYDELESKGGSALNYCRLTQEYTFFSCTDDSWVACEMPGEAMDTSDKSTNKALSAAFKYLSFQGFCIPTDDPDQDADSQSYEIKPRSQRQGAVEPACPKCQKSGLRKSNFKAQLLYCNRKSGGCGWDEEKDGWPGGEEEPGESQSTATDVGASPPDGPPSESEWASLKAIGLHNRYPEAFMKMQIESRQRKGMDSRSIYNEVSEKWSKLNEKAVLDTEEALKDAAAEVGF